jgi:hypothetical protein
VEIGEQIWLLVLDVVRMYLSPLKSGIGAFFTSRGSIVAPVTKDSMLITVVESSVTLSQNRSQPREEMLPNFPSFSFKTVEDTESTYLSQILLLSDYLSVGIQIVQVLE